MTKKQVLVNGGGSYRRWSASGIEEGTSGSWVAHASTHSMPGGKSLPVEAPVLPFAECPTCMLKALTSGMPFAKAKP